MKSLDLFEEFPYIFIFSIFLLSFEISQLISYPLINVFERIYVRSNEIKKEDLNDIYYRDIIDNYPIGAICYCYGKKIDYRDELVAILLKLSLKGNIKILLDKIEIVQESNLYQSEDMLIKHLKGLYIYSKANIKNQVYEDNIQDCLKTDLFLKEGSSTMNIIDLNNRLSLILWLMNFSTIILCSIFYSNSVTAFFMAFISHFLSLFLLIAINGKNKTLLIKNEKGVELRNKLNGLKNFLKDFSRINDRELKELPLWNYYMVYAIIFNLKGVLDKSADNFYKKYINI